MNMRRRRAPEASGGAVMSSTRFATGTPSEFAAPPPACSSSHATDNGIRDDTRSMKSSNLRRSSAILGEPGCPT
eukprot:scaffold22609_cov101-Isochrysis_galbana.AAC.3